MTKKITKGRVYFNSWKKSAKLTYIDSSSTLIQVGTYCTISRSNISKNDIEFYFYSPLSLFTYTTGESTRPVRWRKWFLWYYTTTARLNISWKKIFFYTIDYYSYTTSIISILYIYLWLFDQSKLPPWNHS